MAEIKHDGHLRTMVGLTYAVTIIVLFLSLHGNHWVAYDGGNSGFWNDCSDTVCVNDTTSTTTPTSITTTTSGSEKAVERKCRYIDFTDATGSLNAARAFFLSGYVISCLGAFFCYITWQSQGQKCDKIAIGVSFLSSFLCLVGTLLYTLLHFDEKYGSDSLTYRNARFDNSHRLAIIGVCLGFLLGSIIYKKYLIFTQNECCSLSSILCCSSLHRRIGISRCLACCSKNRTRMSCQEISVTCGNAPNNGDDSYARSGRSGGQNPETGSDTVDSISIVSSSDSTTPRYTGVTPIHLFPMPPSYDDVMRNDSTQEVSNPPPSYDEVANIPRRELILSPPPAYKPS